MKFVATITTKRSNPIFNGHRDPRQVVRFFCELSYDGKVISTSGIWCDSEPRAIKYAYGNLQKIEHDLVRSGYEEYDFETQPDGWGQLHVRDPKEAQDIKNILAKIRP